MSKTGARTAPTTAATSAGIGVSGKAAFQDQATRTPDPTAAPVTVVLIALSVDTKQRLREVREQEADGLQVRACRCKTS